VLAALLLCPLPASGGLTWDIGTIVGYASVVFAAVLYLYPLRGEGLPHRRLFTVSQHRRFGWIALGLAGLHTAIVLITQPLALQYLLPSAPLYMLCGVGALLCLAALVPTGLAARTSLRAASASRSVAITHAILAAALLVLLGAHLIGSGQLVDVRSKTVAVCVLLALPLAWSVQRARIQRLRAGYRAAAVTAAAAALFLLLLPLHALTAMLLEPAAARTHSLPLHFPHESHRQVNCVACHHNFRDETGTASCIDCHRSGRTDLTRSSESTFHAFCRDCHRELALESRRHGPTRECQPCHSAGNVTVAVGP